MKVWRNMKVSRLSEKIQDRALCMIHGALLFMQNNEATGKISCHYWSPSGFLLFEPKASSEIRLAFLAKIHAPYVLLMPRSPHRNCTQKTRAALRDSLLRTVFHAPYLLTASRSERRFRRKQ